MEQARCVEPWQSLDMEEGPQKGTGGFSTDKILTVSHRSGAFADLNEQLFIETVSLPQTGTRFKQGKTTDGWC